MAWRTRTGGCAYKRHRRKQPGEGAQKQHIEKHSSKNKRSDGEEEIERHGEKRNGVALAKRGEGEKSAASKISM